MNHSQPWLRWFSKLVVISTLGLIFAGALVKSHEVGLSVPDWPTTYGKHMFSFPLSDMVGGIFYEHLHRLIATTIGMMTIVLAVGLGFSDRPVWLKKLGYTALGAVILQGMLGGITVLYFLPPAISIFHGMLAQGFLALTVIIAYALSAEREKRLEEKPSNISGVLSKAYWFAGAVVIQLFLGALMRHTGSGLAIPDFPTIGGGWLPVFDAAFMDRINEFMFENDFDTVSLGQVWIHYLHRVGALAVLVLSGYFIVTIFKDGKTPLYSSGFGIAVVILVQIALGAASVWSFRHPIMTSLHVVNGAALLLLTALTILRIRPVMHS